jgi:hypothetical protein
LGLAPAVWMKSPVIGSSVAELTDGNDPFAGSGTPGRDR